MMEMMTEKTDNVISAEDILELNADFDRLDELEAEKHKVWNRIGSRMTRKTQKQILESIKLTAEEYIALPKDAQRKYIQRYTAIARAWDTWKTKRWKPLQILQPWGNLYTWNPEEYWRPINHYITDDNRMLSEPLLVSTMGNVWSLNLGDYKMPCLHNGESYITITTFDPYSDDNSRSPGYISMKQLVANTFPALVLKGEGCNQIIHRNGDIWDNRTTNLEWVKRKHKTYTRKEVTA